MNSDTITIPKAHATHIIGVMMASIGSLEKIGSDTSVSNHYRTDCIRAMTDIGICCGLMSGAGGTEVSVSHGEPEKESKETFGFANYTRENRAKQANTVS